MISIEQNKERQLTRLRAQRQLYFSAKNIFEWQVFLAGPISVGAIILSSRYPSMKGLVAAWGLFLTLLDIFWLTPWRKKIQDVAARIQESFDCDVLDLPWQELKAGKKPDDELIKEHADKYDRHNPNDESIENWYSAKVDELPIYMARIACQRSNCWWDAEQRRYYARIFIVSILIIFMVFLFLAILTKSSLENYIISIIVPLSPLLLLGIRHYLEQKEASSRLDSLKEHASSLWDEALSGKSATDMTARSRVLQDEILENRRKTPPVLDVIYQHLRSKHEKQMNYCIEKLVLEAKRKGGVVA